MMMAEGQAFRLSLCKGEEIKGYEWVGTNNINSSSYPQDKRWCGPEHDPHACKDRWFGNIVFQKALSSDVHWHDVGGVAVYLLVKWGCYNASHVIKAYIWKKMGLKSTSPQGIDCQENLKLTAWIDHHTLSPHQKPLLFST